MHDLLVCADELLVERDESAAGAGGFGGIGSGGHRPGNHCVGHQRRAASAVAGAEHLRTDLDAGAGVLRIPAPALVRYRFRSGPNPVSPQQTTSRCPRSETEQADRATRSASKGARQRAPLLAGTPVTMTHPVRNRIASRYGMPAYRNIGTPAAASSASTRGRTPRELRARQQLRSCPAAARPHQAASAESLLTTNSPSTGR